MKIKELEKEIENLKVLLNKSIEQIIANQWIKKEAYGNRIFNVTNNQNHL